MKALPFYFWALCSASSSLTLFATAANEAGAGGTGADVVPIMEDEIPMHNNRNLKKWWAAQMKAKGGGQWMKGNGKWAMMKSGKSGKSSKSSTYKMNVFKGMGKSGMRYKGKGKGKGYYMYKGKGQAMKTSPPSKSPTTKSPTTASPTNAPTAPSTSAPTVTLNPTVGPTPSPTDLICWRQVGSDVASSPLSVNLQFAFNGGISLNTIGRLYVVYYEDSARVFSLSGTEWVEVGSTTDLAATFGTAGIDNVWLEATVATPIPQAVLFEEDDAANANFAFLRFDVSAGTWSRYASVGLETVQDIGGWNWAFAGSGLVVAVSTHGVSDDPATTTTSEVEVYTIAGDTLTLRDTFTRSTTSPADNNLGGGLALSFDGSLLVIGDNVLNDDAGQVQVYSFDGTNYNQVGGDINGATDELLGSEVYVSGDGGFVAATYFTSFPDASGVRIYRLENDVWVQVADIANQGGFAWSFDGQRLYIDQATNYLYSADTNTYSLVQGAEQTSTFLPSDLTMLDDSYSVAADGRSLAFAVGSEDQPGTYQVFANSC